MRRRTLFSMVAVIGLLVWTPALSQTSLRYRGDLETRGEPADGRYDFTFRLFDAQDPAAGSPIGEEIALRGVPVRSGRFEVDLVFDAPNTEAWLEVSVKRSGSFQRFEVLEPRQRVGLTPEAQAVVVPTGIVAFFNRQLCPSGWSEYLPAQGRAVVGLNILGTLQGQVGTALGDLVTPQHVHADGSLAETSTEPSHQHVWSKLTSGWVWRSYASNGSEFTVKDWGNGVGKVGSGLYPLASNSTNTFYTSSNGGHRHTVGSTTTEQASTPPTLPYLQLLACIKN